MTVVSRTTRTRRLALPWLLQRSNSSQIKPELNVSHSLCDTCGLYVASGVQTTAFTFCFEYVVETDADILQLEYTTWTEVDVVERHGQLICAVYVVCYCIHPPQAHQENIKATTHLGLYRTRSQFLSLAVSIRSSFVDI